MNKISTFVFDVDGVLTDGSVMVFQNGQLVRTMNVKDGYALQLAVKKGYRIAIISGGNNTDVRERLNGLGVVDVYLNASDKIEALDELKNIYDLNLEEVLYMGDDIPDLQVMKECGLATCPADAAEEIKAICHYVSPRNGGKGCARDVIEQVLKVQGKWLNNGDHTW